MNGKELIMKAQCTLRTTVPKFASNNITASASGCGRVKMKGNLISLISVTFILFVSMAMTGCRPAAHYAHIAYLYQEKGQHDKAIENAKQGVAYYPQYAPNWYWMGIAYYSKRNYDEAISALNKVVELRPTGELVQPSHMLLGGAYYLKGNYSEAIRNSNKALELEPSDSLALFFRGAAYSGKGNYDDAIRDLNKAIELKPSASFALDIRGWAYYGKGNYNEAIRDFDKAIENVEHKEKDIMRKALRGKAFSFLGLGDKEAALNLIKQAKAASDYDNNHDLSLIYYVTGDKEKAWEYRGGKGMVGIEVKDHKKGSNIGAEVVKTTAGGPGEKAGILAGDVIVRLDDKDVAGTMDFVSKAKTLVPGTTAKIKILREDIEKEIPVKVAFADVLIESDPLIAPIMAKKKSKPETAVKLPHEVSPVIKSDVDELPSIKAKPNNKSYAIVIGIEGYRQKLPKVDFAVSDAKIMVEYLTRVLGYPEENVVVLVNDNAAKSDFEKYFEKWLPNNADPGSTVFVYYSGHGAPNPKTGDAYLVPYDGDPAFIAETGYSLKRMYDALGRLPAKEIIVALDSCFSGAGGRSVLAKGARPLVMNLNTAAPAKNMTVLAASSGEQISSTYDEKGHGLFTYFLLKGIKNEDVVQQDGALDIPALFDYVKPQVTSIARKKYNNEQTPQLIGAGN